MDERVSVLKPMKSSILFDKESNRPILTSPRVIETKPFVIDIPIEELQLSKIGVCV